MDISSNKIQSFYELSDKFTVFVFDLCGVVHDGVSLKPQTLHFIAELRKLGKHVIFLSNSPNSSSRAISLLESNGFETLKDEKFYTSGDFFINFIKNNPNYKNKKYYFFGKDYNEKFLKDNNLLIIDNIDEAEFIIASPFSSNKQEIAELEKYVETILDYKLPLICINPDMYAPHGNEIRFTPGYFAKKYEDLGGSVQYFGKPYKEIYEFILNDLLKNKKIPKEQVLMVGDSMHTDIRGAKNYGIQSLLVGNGYHRHIDFDNAMELKKLFNEFSFEPDYYINI